MTPIGAAALKEAGKATLRALGTTAVGEAAKAASKKVVDTIFNRKSAAESSAEELQKHRQQIAEELTGEFQKQQQQIKAGLTQELQKHRQQVTEELQKHQRQITEELVEEFQKQQKQLAVLVGIVCVILGSVVGGSVTWYVLQSSRHSEQVLSLKELERYEKARDAGLQALENYVIQNPNSPYIAQAKALIRTYKGAE